MKPTTNDDLIAISRKKWLGCTDIARILGVSTSTVKNLWTSGRLAYKIANNTQRARKSSMLMIKNYQNTLILY